MPGILFYLLVQLLVVNTSFAQPDWKQGPNWKQGQEFLYRGTVKFTGQSSDIQLLEQYTLEVRVLVTRVQQNTSELVCSTKLLLTNSPNSDATPSVKLTYLNVDRLGNITSSTAASGKSIIIDGPATFENGFLVPLPTEPIAPGKPWEAIEPGRLPRRLTWTPAQDNQGNDTVQSVQESIDWQRPRGDSIAWHRTETMTFQQSGSLPYKVHRLVERRPPGHRQATYQITTEYQLVSAELLQGPMLEERLADIQELRIFQNDVAQLSQAAHDRQAQKAWSKLALKLKEYQNASGKTPYRDALLTLQQTVQDGLDNRLSPVKYEVAEKSIEVGQLIPPFTLLTQHSTTITSQQLRGKPCLLIFVQPGSELTKSLYEEIPLRLKRLNSTHWTCFFLTSKTGKLPDTIRSDSPLIEVAMGQPLLTSYNVVATPHFVLLDADGTLIASMEGWGPEIEQQLEKLLKQEIAKKR